MNFEANCQVGAWYKLEAFDHATGETRDLSGWTPNLVTDSGLDFFKNTQAATSTGSNVVYTHCAVSADNTPPVITNTSLEQLVAVTNTTMTVAGSYGSGYQQATQTDPHYWWQRTTYVFPEGVAQGNLSKIGLIRRSGNVDNLISVALIKDTAGNPTTISLQPTEELRAVVEFRIYPGSVNVIEDSVNVVDGANVVKSTHQIRMVPRKETLSLSDHTYKATLMSLTSYSQRYVAFYQNATITDYDNVAMSGQSTSRSNSQFQNDINDGVSRQSTMTTTLTTGDMNTGGVGGLVVRGGISSWNVAINPPIPKTSAYQLTFSFTEKVSRYTG